MARKRKRRAWSPTEVRSLQSLCLRRASGDRRPTVHGFARRNKRTEGATRQKIFDLGLSLTG